MIEAVNSAIAQNAVLRASQGQGTEQRTAVSPVASVAVSSDDAPSIQLAPFVSPYIQVDNQFDKAVLQIRDSDTGDVLRQFPSENTLRSRAQTDELEAFQSNNASRSVASAEQTAQSSASSQSLFNVSQLASSDTAVAATPVSGSAQAQVAAATFSAIANGAQGGSTVSVTA